MLRRHPLVLVPGEGAKEGSGRKTVLAMTAALITGHTVATGSGLAAGPHAGVERFLQVQVEKTAAFVSHVGQPQGVSQTSGEAAGLNDRQHLLDFAEAGEVREAAVQGVIAEE